VGILNLQIPQVRGLCFYPQSLEKGSRSERALKVAIAQMYLKGVSTRRVEKITKELCGLEISSAQVSRAAKELDDEFEKFRNRPLTCYKYVVLDAFYPKVRHNGTVIDQAVLIAYGVNQFGKREILGTSISLSEAEVHWREFLEGLVKRGLCGIELITSDNHYGLRSALQKVFPSVRWQRCQFHMSQNAQKYAPRKELKEPIAEGMREIFNSRNASEARQIFKEVASRFSKSAPEFSKWLENNIEEGLTCFAFPNKHRKKIRTSNGIERVNREIRRRTGVAMLFPNAESALRLITGVLIEIHEEWVTGNCYLDMSVQQEPTNSSVKEREARAV